MILELVTPEVAVAAMGVLTAGITGYFSYRSYLDKGKLAQAESEIAIQRGFLSFSEFIEQWDSIYQDLQHLIETTCIDRILILRACNGFFTPKWTSAVLQIREGNQEPVSYIHFELDGDYIERLRSIETIGPAYYKVDEMPECSIKDVYKMEDVKASLWTYISSAEIDKVARTRAVTYCTFSTSSVDDIPTEVQTRCKVLSHKLKYIVTDFYTKEQK